MEENNKFLRKGNQAAGWFWESFFKLMEISNSQLVLHPGGVNGQALLSEVAQMNGCGSALANQIFFFSEKNGWKITF